MASTAIALYRPFTVRTGSGSRRVASSSAQSASTKNTSRLRNRVYAQAWVGMSCTSVTRRNSPSAQSASNFTCVMSLLYGIHREKLTRPPPVGRLAVSSRALGITSRTRDTLPGLPVFW